MKLDELRLAAEMAKEHMVPLEVALGVVRVEKKAREAVVATEGITITKRGVPPQERIWAGRCSNCGTEVEAVQRVLKVVHADQRDGPHARHDCPVCKLKDGIVLYPKNEVQDFAAKR